MDKVKIFAIWFVLLWLTGGFGHDLYQAWHTQGIEANGAMHKIIHEWASNNQLVTFVVGVLCGHFFWSQK